MRGLLLREDGGKGREGGKKREGEVRREC